MTTGPVTADLRPLATTGTPRTVRRFEAFQAGGGGLVAKAAVIRQHARCRWLDDELVITFHRAGAFVETSVTTLGLPADWRGYRQLELRATGPLELVVLGARCRLATRSRRLDLTDLPLAAGIQPLFEPTGLRFVARRRGTVRLRALALHPRPATGGQKSGCSVGCPQPSRAVHGCAETAHPTTPPPPHPVVDRFGQRIHATWPGKVHRVADLHRPEPLPAPPTGRDGFSGWTGGPAFAPGKFFRVTSDRQGRWWFVTPSGRPFWSIGTTCVRTTEVTPVAGREFLFEQPTDNFYLANVCRKYRSLTAWRDHTLARFQAWGFNTIGSFTAQELVLGQQVVPHTRIVRTRPAPVAELRPGFPDVFDPAWGRWLDDLFAREVAPHRDNPWLLGWFVDNEWHWRNWGAGGRRYAAKYFGTVARLLRKHDPHHLYLGCRFVRLPPDPGIVRAAGRHVDVLSVNCYALWPDRAAFRDWHEQSGGKPVLIGEHHLPLASPRQLPPLYRCFTAAERRRYYEKFVREWARQPWSLGCHWFQYTDQPLTGRASNGENQPIGFVDITDQPHAELVAAARAATAHMYRWHVTAPLTEHRHSRYNRQP